MGGYPRQAFLAGLLTPADELSRRTLDGLILADIATAQELTGRLGRLDRIDLILPGDEGAVADELRALLPAGAQIVGVEARAGTIEEMTAAFRLNLLALSLLALVVGLFLIYNTMTFSVVQRRPLFGTLRCLGVTRREVFALVVSEALVVGVLGAVLGLGLGIVMGRGAVQAVTQTINDLYFVVTVQEIEIASQQPGQGRAAGHPGHRAGRRAAGLGSGLGAAARRPLPLRPGGQSPARRRLGGRRQPGPGCPGSGTAGHPHPQPDGQLCRHPGHRRRLCRADAPGDHAC